MKKLLAILLSVLMLCTMIPFVAVSAEGEINLVIEADVEEAVSGDEIAVSVYLNDIPDVGLIGAQVEILFDSDVFELVTYYDEDEEAWIPPIEVGSKYNASSNKYIMFAPIDEDTGAMDMCRVQYLRATASATQVRKEDHFYTVTFTVKDDAPAGNYKLTVNPDPEATSMLIYGTVKHPYIANEIEIAVNGGASEEPECEHEYAYDCSKVCSKCGEETRPEADHAYFYPCDAYCMYCYELTNENAAHNEIHVDAVEATCQVNGNIEYWYCDVCGASWDVNGMPVNRFTVITFGEHVYTNPCDAHCAVCGELTNEEAAHTIVAVDAVEPTCTENGNVAYWYCSDCGAAWLDAECTMVTNLQSVVLGASCSYNAIYSEGVEPGCHYTGWTENWYCANCDVYYLDAACTIITNYKSLTIPALQDSAEYVPAKAATCDEPGNTEYWVCYECEQIWADAALTQLTNIKNVTIDITHNVIHVEAKAATCDEPGNIEYWYCADCGAAWLDEYCRLNTNLNAVILPISHNVIHVEAKEPTCTELGNIEFWYCADCGAAWLDEYCHLNTNMMAVKLAASCKYGAEYTEAKAATCYEPGNTEYWYCANCDVYYADADCTIVTNAKNVIIPISHNIIHVEAVAATCVANGNIEYWYCADCGQAWLDEYCHLNTNLRAVVLPMAEHEFFNDCETVCINCYQEVREASHNIVHVEAKAATCAENGNIEYWYCDACGAAWLNAECTLNTNLRAVILPATGEHTYDDVRDADCNVCGAIREVSSPISYGGMSVSEETSTGCGLAFLFNAEVIMTKPETYIADYTNAKIIINGVEYGLKSMGAQVWVDGGVAVTVPAKKLYDHVDDAVKFAVRVTNIPADQQNTPIYAQAYYTYYEIDGTETTIYCDDDIRSGSYNGVLSNAQ